MRFYLELCFNSVHVNLSTPQTDRTERTAEALRLSRDIVENMAEGLLLIRASDGIITYTNPCLDRMFGYERGELAGQHITVLNAPGAKTPQETAAEIDAGLRKHGYWSGEVYNVQKDGTPFWNEVSVSTFESSHGPVYVSVHENIDERKKAQDALRVVLDGTSRATGERFFPLLVQHLATALGVRSAFAAEVVDEAGSRLRLLGIYDNGSLGEPYEYDTAGSPCEKVLEEGRAHYAEGVCELFPGDSELQEWGIESYLAIALHDAAGNPIGHLGIGDDRAMPARANAEPILEIFAARAGAELERMRATNALAESEERLRLFVEHAPAAVAMVDVELRFLCHSRRFTNLHTPERRDLRGEHLYEVLPLARRWSDVHERCLAGAVERRSEDPLRLPDGSTAWLKWEIRPWVDGSGKIGGLIIFTENITDRRNAQRELARHRDRLGTLAAGVGHDMANLLLPLRCRLDALEQEELSPAARDQLREVRRSTDYLQQLTDGLRLLSLDPEEIDASTAVTELAGWWDEVGALISSALPPEASFSVDWPADLPPVRVSTQRLSQALLNLVVNAGQAISGRGIVHVKARLSRDRRVVHISVTDDGRGMSPEVRRQAFDPFFTTRTRGLGSGLGLSLVRGVAVSAGGSVDIDSEPGKGTTVVLTLPARSANPRVEPRPRGRASVSIRDPRIASLASALLEASGFDLVDGDPGASDLWIAEPSAEKLGAARRFLDEPGRRLIVVGALPPDWAELDAGLVPEAGDFESMRAQIREAAVALEGTA